MKLQGPTFFLTPPHTSLQSPTNLGFDDLHYSLYEFSRTTITKYYNLGALTAEMHCSQYSRTEGYLVRLSQGPLTFKCLSASEQLGQPSTCERGAGTLWWSSHWQKLNSSRTKRSPTSSSVQGRCPQPRSWTCALYLECCHPTPFIWPGPAHPLVSSKMSLRDVFPNRQTAQTKLGSPALSF